MSFNLKHTFVTSDHHFGSHCLPSLFHVFSKEQEKELVDKWNSIVGKNDIVYYNGDFCDGNLTDLCNYASQLHGQIVLIRGNHDNFNDEIYKAVFVDVTDEIVLEDFDLSIHHIPRANIKTSKEVFGHLHRDLERPLSTQKSICSCVQFSDGYPMSLEKIILDLI